MFGVSHAFELLVLWLILNTGSGSVRFHTAVVFLIQSVVVVACHIHGFLCRGCWIRVFCCLFVVCIYVFGLLCRATCSFVSASMFLVSHAVQNEKKLWNYHIG